MYFTLYKCISSFIEPLTITKEKWTPNIPEENVKAGQPVSAYYNVSDPGGCVTIYKSDNSSYYFIAVQSDDPAYKNKLTIENPSRKHNGNYTVKCTSPVGETKILKNITIDVKDKPEKPQVSSMGHFVIIQTNR